MKKDFIPRKDSEFNQWVRSFSTALPDVAARVGLPQEMTDAIADLQPKWLASFRALTEARNAYKAACHDKAAKRKEYEKMIRTVSGTLQFNTKMTDADRATLRLTVPDRHPTPALPDYVAQLAPPLLILASQRGQITIHFGRNPYNEKNNGKPRGIFCARLYYRIGTGEWKHLAEDTRSPYVHILTGDSVALVEYKAQWVDKQMNGGPFGDTNTATYQPA